MAKLRATAQLIKDMRIVADNNRSHSVCLDLPLDTGTDMGPTALELCAMSLAGCYATIFALTAKKMRVPLKDLEVSLEAVKSEEAGTFTEARLDINVEADVPEDRIQRIHELTLSDCPVGKLFEKAGVKTNYSFKIVKR